MKNQIPIRVPIQIQILDIFTSALVGLLSGRKSFPLCRDMDEASDILLVELSRIIKILKTREILQ